ncbi:class I SAM-dependent methyltransferase [Candidatus Saccharibacteria bacterium]|nr:class I SAM-dependent methyltransferase [Candidatus Saccharibacteria bacterium]
MRKQQKIWLEEHNRMGTLPTMANIDPASGVILFTDWLQSNTIIKAKRAVDIGAGKGRNSVHLAKLGCKVWALEYIEPALESAKQLAKANEVNESIEFKLCEVDQTWEFENDFFDFAIDSFSSIDIETLEGRKKCRDEMYRTLKPRGYALVTVCSADDEWEKELIEKYPGTEPNSTIWPQNGKFQKDYSEDELKEFYRKFKIVEFRTINKPAHKLGRDGTATNFWMLIQKQ